MAVPSEAITNVTAMMRFAGGRVPSIVASIMLGYLYAFISLAYGLFPAPLIIEAGKAVEALKIAHGPNNSVQPNPFGASGVVRRQEKWMQPGLTFLTAYRNGQFGAYLITTDGTVVHEWHIAYSKVWPQAPHLIYQAPDEKVVWGGARLLANGDVVLSFDSEHFPYGGGLVRIDRNSTLIWSLPVNAHHLLTMDADGTFWVPAQRYLATGSAEFPFLSQEHYEDSIIHVSADGRILREYSIMRAIFHSNYRGLLAIQDRPSGRSMKAWVTVEGIDPTHLNYVEALPAEWASRFPQFMPGDLLVSFRNRQSIAVIDKTTGLVKWALRGPFVRQHNPQFLPNGHILVLDNMGGGPDLDRSRVLEIDPATQSIVWCYDRDLYSPIRGSVQVLSNGNVLIAESQRGRVLEVTKDNRVVWEYVNGVSERVDGSPAVGIVTTAARIAREKLDFLERPPQ